jgi:hypothetical protein
VIDSFPSLEAEKIVGRHQSTRETIRLYLSQWHVSTKKELRCKKHLDDETNGT